MMKKYSTALILASLLIAGCIKERYQMSLQ